MNFARAGELTHDLPADIVMVSQQVNTLAEVDQRDMSFTVELWSRAIWFDPRLRYNSTCEKPPGVKSGYETYGYHQSFDFGSHFHKIWRPSLVVSNLREVEKVFEEQFWVEASGRVWWTRKVRWTLGCEMDFRYLPFDRQQCMIEVKEFRYPAAEVALSFLTEWTSLANQPDASISMNMDVAQPVRTPSCTTGGAVGWHVDFTNTYGAAPMGDDAVSIGATLSSLIFVFDLVRDTTYMYYKEFVIRPANLDRDRQLRLLLREQKRGAGARRHVHHLHFDAERHLRLRGQLAAADLGQSLASRVCDAHVLDGRHSDDRIHDCSLPHARRVAPQAAPRRGKAGACSQGRRGAGKVRGDCASGGRSWCCGECRVGLHRGGL